VLVMQFPLLASAVCWRLRETAVVYVSGGSTAGLAVARRSAMLTSAYVHDILILRGQLRHIGWCAIRQFHGTVQEQ
jgi:hypothetical protein